MKDETHRLAGIGGSSQWIEKNPYAGWRRHCSVTERLEGIIKIVKRKHLKTIIRTV